MKAFLALLLTLTCLTASAQNYPTTRLDAFTGIPSAAAQAQSSSTDLAFNSLSAPADTLKGHTQVYGVSLLHMLDVLPGGHTGARNVFVSEVDLNGQSAAGSDNRDYVAGYFRGIANSGDGGTSSAPLGAIFALNPVTECGSAAAYMLDCTAMEADVGLYGSSAFRTGLRIASFGPGHAGTLDAALAISTLGSGTNGFNRGIVFQNLGGGENPVSGILISGADSPGTGNLLTAAEGIDFSGFTFSGPALVLPGGFVVDNTGILTNAAINTGNISSNGTIAAPYVQATGASYPKVMWDATANATDLKFFQSFVDPSGSWNLTTINDALTASTLALQINRTPTAVLNVTIPPLLIASGGETVTGPFASNPNLASAAPAYTSANTTLNLFNDSSDTLTQAWADVFGTSANTTHDTGSFMTTSQVGSSILQADAISAFCRNKNATSYAAGTNACVGVQSNVFNNVPGAASWSISQIFNENQDSADTMTPSAYLNESDFKVARPTTNVIGWQYVLDGLMIGGVPVQSASATGPTCLSTNAAKWTNCLLTGDGAAVSVLTAGMTAVPSATTIGSQFIAMKTSTTTGVTHLNRIHALDQYTILDRSDGGEADLSLANGSVSLVAGKHYLVNGQPGAETDSAGHMVFDGGAGGAPTPSGCGTSPSMVTGARDNAGTVLVGSGTVMSCTITFAASFASGVRPAPSCVATLYNNGQPIWLTARSPTAVTFSATGSFGGAEIDYHCL
jgi:hypothetical protein